MASEDRIPADGLAAAYADPEFRRFAAMVADAVMWVQNVKGLKLSAAGFIGQCCPLGAVQIKGGNNCPYPWFSVSSEERTFAYGFDSNGAHISRSNPYYRLGAAYRRWALARSGK